MDDRPSSRHSLLRRSDRIGFLLLSVSCGTYLFCEQHVRVHVWHVGHTEHFFNIYLVSNQTMKETGKPKES